MPNSCSAFSPMIFRPASLAWGSFMMVRGWSKSWCSQSSETIAPAQLIRSMVATRSLQVVRLLDRLRREPHPLPDVVAPAAAPGTAPCAALSLKYLSIRHIMRHPGDPASPVNTTHGLGKRAGTRVDGLVRFAIMANA